MPWYRLSRRSDDRDTVDVQSLFWIAFQQVTRVKKVILCEMAMFGTRAPRGAQSFLYFSPATADLAPEFLKAVRAQACERPPSDINFIMGDESTRRQFEGGEV